MKLTRKQIKEGLEATPIDTLLMGSPKTLTAKQKEFARQVAMGKPKAEAYREAYDTNTTANAQAVEGYRLSNNPHISLMIESMKVSLEAQKYLLPAHLRALTIQKLTEKALDPDVNHAQQIKALELLGKITEVALFSERKEIITTDTSATAKDRLIQSLAQAIRSSANISMDKKAEADQLLAEITGGSLSNPEPDTIDQASEDNITQEDKAEGYLQSEPEAEENENRETPPTPTQPNVEFFGDPTTHTIPDKQIRSETDGEGVDDFWKEIENVSTETPPLSNWNENEEKNI
jgi:hypothetical protein